MSFSQKFIGENSIRVKSYLRDSIFIEFLMRDDVPIIQLPEKKASAILH